MVLSIPVGVETLECAIFSLAAGNGIVHRLN
jgi:hypothetical protein